MDRLKKFYHDKVYSEATGYLLNALTLRISDKEIAAQVRKRQYTSFNDIYVIFAITALIGFAHALYLYFAGNAPIFFVFTSSVTIINGGFIGLLKWKRPEKSTYLTATYMLNHVVFTCLFFHGYLGEWKDRTAYSQQIVVNFILVNSVLFNDITMIIFWQVPCFMVGMYIQSLGECNIANENLEFLKSEGSDTGEFNCNAHITLVMTRSQ